MPNLIEGGQIASLGGFSFSWAPVAVSEKASPRQRCHQNMGNLWIEPEDSKLVGVFEVRCWRGAGMCVVLDSVIGGHH